MESITIPGDPFHVKDRITHDRTKQKRTRYPRTSSSSMILSQPAPRARRVGQLLCCSNSMILSCPPPTGVNNPYPPPGSSVYKRCNSMSPVQYDAVRNPPFSAMRGLPLCAVNPAFLKASRVCVIAPVRDALLVSSRITRNAYEQPCPQTAIRDFPSAPSLLNPSTHKKEVTK